MHVCMHVCMYMPAYGKIFQDASCQVCGVIRSYTHAYICKTYTHAGIKACMHM